jgi:integrase
MTRRTKIEALPPKHPTNASVRSLPIGMWPQADRAAWELACTPSLRLNRGGLAGHLKPITQKDLARRYGYFLDHLDRHKRLDLNAAAGSQVTFVPVDAYVTELKSRVGSVTVYGSIHKLRRTAQILAPSLDFTWLCEIEKDLALVMEPRSKADRFVLTEVLLEAGLSLIADAQSAPALSDLDRAIGVRNGLMIAVLGLCPIRLKNFAALTIGTTFRNIKNSWWIVLSAADTKEKRPDERRIDDILAPAIERYIDVRRPVLMRRTSPHARLWVSSNTSAPLSYSGVEKTISATTKSAIGVDVSPHLFRTAGASTAATHGSTSPHLGSALLNHADPRVTEEHYNRATILSAGMALAEVAQQYRRTD